MLSLPEEPSTVVSLQPKKRVFKKKESPYGTNVAKHKIFVRKMFLDGAQFHGA